MNSAVYKKILNLLRSSAGLDAAALVSPIRTASAQTESICFNSFRVSLAPETRGISGVFPEETQERTCPDCAVGRDSLASYQHNAFLYLQDCSVDAATYGSLRLPVFKLLRSVCFCSMLGFKVIVFPGHMYTK